MKELGLLTGKIMTTVFREDKGVIMVDYLKNSKSTNGTFYEDDVHRLCIKIRTMRRGKHAAGVIFH